MNKYYVIGAYDDHYGAPLNRYPVDSKEARRMIQWQGEGTRWHTCVASNIKGRFIDMDGLEIEPKNLIYTEAAWQSFLDRVWPEKEKT